MPLSPAERKAFEGKLGDILRQADDLGDDAVARALQLLGETRRGILDELARVPAETFTAQHLAGLRQAVDEAARELVRRYQGAMPSLLERAQELGIDLAEEPLRAAGVFVQAPAALVSQNLLAVLQGYSADLIQNLGDEARRRINTVLGQAALGTISPFEAIQQIAGAVPGPSVFPTLEARAEAIFRTEVNRTLSVAHQARMNQLADAFPGLRKRWVAVGDSRTRATHLEASGQVVGAKEKFSVGGFEADFPRDPVLPARESVNCRCWSVPVAEDVLEDTGRPPPPAEPGEPPARGQAPFGEAKTVREATAQARTRFGEGVAVDYKGVDVKVANEMNRTLAELADAYPEVGLRYLGSAQGMRRRFLPRSRVSGRRYAEAAGQYRAVGINTKYANDPDGMLRSLLSDVENGWHPPGTGSVAGIATHEFGHLVHESLPAEAIRELQAAVDALPLAEIRAGLSRYATQDGHEFFAEAFAEYRMSSRPRAIADKIGKIIDRFVGSK